MTKISLNASLSQAAVCVRVDILVEQNCRDPTWRKYFGRTRGGGTLYDAVRTIGQCLNYCNANASCVGVDIDVNLFPLRCFILHVDYNENILRNQPGTDNYKLITRCANPPKGLMFFLTLRHIYSTYQ